MRVSDQVQIGDYKLYLKAEGVEQVDDARTMPIERVDANGAPTDVMPAMTPTLPITAQQAAVAPPAATPPAPAPAAAPQLVGNPARTMVAIPGDDASGRPVATAAAVAALTAPVGHGKLAVLSSNFAGKEFDLSRSQMIIGRTDENDIVINHRSISRNHAKIARDPETARYTISDLNSSNGVRVNGQDYSKVELRRGDVVDLGHVRLRFIEPGEDFVFARDAVITDVPESGGKRGMLVAIILGVVVLGAAAAFIMMHGGGDGGKDQPAQVADASGQTRVVAPDIDARAPNIEASPDAAVAMADLPADASTAVKPDDSSGIALECQAFGGSKQQWDKEIELRERQAEGARPERGAGARRGGDRREERRGVVGQAGEGDRREEPRTGARAARPDRPGVGLQQGRAGRVRQGQARGVRCRARRRQQLREAPPVRRDEVLPRQAREVGRPRRHEPVPQHAVYRTGRR